MLLGTFTLLCEHQHHPPLEFWSSCKTETQDPGSTNSPFAPPPAPGSHHSTFSLYECDLITCQEAYSIFRFRSGLLHAVKHLQGSSTLHAVCAQENQFLTLILLFFKDNNKRVGIDGSAFQNNGPMSSALVHQVQSTWDKGFWHRGGRRLRSLSPGVVFTLNFYILVCLSFTYF